METCFLTTNRTSSTEDEIITEQIIFLQLHIHFISPKNYTILPFSFSIIIFRTKVAFTSSSFRFVVAFRAAVSKGSLLVCFWLGYLVACCNFSCLPSCNDFAIIPQVNAITEDSHDGERKTVSGINAYAHSGQSRTIHAYNGCYDQLQYPLISPYGDIGWHHLVNDMTKGKQVIDLTKDEEVIDQRKDEDDVQFFTPSMKQPIEQISTYTETSLADLGTPSSCKRISLEDVNKTTTAVTIQHVDDDVPLLSKVDASVTEEDIAGIEKDYSEGQLDKHGETPKKKTKPIDKKM